MGNSDHTCLFGVNYAPRLAFPVAAHRLYLVLHTELRRLVAVFPTDQDDRSSLSAHQPSFGETLLPRASPVSKYLRHCTSGPLGKTRLGTPSANVSRETLPQKTGGLGRRFTLVSREILSPRCATTKTGAERASCELQPTASHDPDLQKHSSRTKQWTWSCSRSA
jgi:hypothetical protein